MARVFAMFPGQGSQTVGMGKDLLEAFPGIAPVFEEAEDAAGIPIRKLCFEGPMEELTQTANTQPCILATSVAVWQVLKNETGIDPALYAGHSLGEYPALVASGKLALARAAMLVRRRGEAMQRAVPAGVGAMAAVLKVPEAELEEKCRAHSSADGQVCIANYNSPDQLVVAGHATAVASLGEELSAAKVRVVPLPVSAPFHSPLMAPARDEMQGLLQDTEIQSNDAAIIANVSGEVVRDYSTNLLIEQIDHPVRWTKTLQTVQDEGAEVCIEIGPGKVLFGLARKTLPRKSVQLLATEDIRGAIEKINSL